MIDTPSGFRFSLNQLYGDLRSEKVTIAKVMTAAKMFQLCGFKIHECLKSRGSPAGAVDHARTVGSSED